MSSAGLPRHSVAQQRTLEQILETELFLLRALCNGLVHDDEREEVFRMLSIYNWRGRDHQIVYEVLSRLGATSPKTIRANLAAELTRKGFPDISVAEYFVTENLPQQNYLDLIRALVTNSPLAQ